MKALKALIVLYIIVLLAAAFLFGYSLFIDPNLFYPVINIASILFNDPIIAAIVIVAALIPLIIMIVALKRQNKPTQTAYKPQSNLSTYTPTTGYNPQPSQPTVYEPRGQTISDPIIEETTTIEE